MTSGRSTPSTSRRTSVAVASVRPRPGPTAIAANRDAPSSTSSAHPSAATGCTTASIGAARSGHARCRQPQVPGAAAQRGHRRQPRRAGHLGRAGDQPDGVAPLVVVRRALGHPRDDVLVGHQVRPSHADTSRPMSASSTSPQCPAPSAISSPGFSAANVTVANACAGSPAAIAGQPRHARGDVDGQHRGTVGVGEGVGRHGSPVPNAASITRSHDGSTVGRVQRVHDGARAPPAPRAARRRPVRPSRCCPGRPRPRPARP